MEAGLAIEAYVDDLTGGKGLAWMNEYLGDISINLGDIDRGRGVPGSITLPNWWTGKPKYHQYYVVHELAHIWDANTGHIGILGVVDGPGDFLNEFIHDGNFGVGVSGTWACRFCDGSGSDHIPSKYQFGSGVMVARDGSPYGNNSTADYLAESFALNVFYPNGNHVPLAATAWVNTFISLQASYLP